MIVIFLAWLCAFELVVLWWVARYAYNGRVALDEFIAVAEQIQARADYWKERALKAESLASRNESHGSDTVTENRDSKRDVQ